MCIIKLIVLVFIIPLFNFSKLQNIFKALAEFTSKFRPAACIISTWV